MEEWKNIPGLPNHQVSSEGQVRSKDRVVTTGPRHKRVLKGTRVPARKVEGRALAQKDDREGYMRVKLQGKAYHVHRLVAWAFLGPQAKGIHVRHLNGNPKDNRIGNIAYGTPRDNYFDSVRHGTARLMPKT